MKTIKNILLLPGFLLVLLLTACTGEVSFPTGITSTPEQVAVQTPVLVTSTPQPEALHFDFSQSFQPIPVDGTYEFTEGPAVDPSGNVYFSDINAGRIYTWSTSGTVSVFMEGLNAPNGLAFDQAGNLIVCEGGNGRLISIDPLGTLTVLADQYNQVRFNEPNDLWIDPNGGIYFTDPAFQSPVVQDGEDVYYLTPDRSQVIRVIDDLVRPNGIVGTEDGTRLYVPDYGAGMTFVYIINPDGSLSNRQLLVATGSDGMDLDGDGNIYLTTPGQVQVFTSAGVPLGDIPLQEDPTNLAFTGEDDQILFITARTMVFTIDMSTAGAVGATSPVTETNSQGFVLSSPEVIEGGDLPMDYTCDGDSATLPLTWSGAPEDTQSFVIIMHHVASADDVHWYWVLYDIPADITSLPRNTTGIGSLGTNSVNDRTEYAPPCSQGPGEKNYTFTIYALSGTPQFSVPADQIDRDAMLEAIQGITLASAELHVTYTRR